MPLPLIFAAATPIMSTLAPLFAGWGNTSFFANRNENGNINMTNVYVSTTPNTAVPTGSKSGSKPGSTPGSSSSADTTSVIYEPQPSDLAYLLHDSDKKVYNDPAATSIPIPVKYIVENLKEYGTKCIPLNVYVSALLRTWETALLLYLPFLFNATQPDYSQTLILEVSPFLLEKDEFSAFKQNSNKPLDFIGNVQEFFKFIKLFIYFIHLNNKNEGNIMGIPELYLQEIPNNFTIILIAGSQKVCLRINIKEKKVEYFAPSIQLNQNPITIPPMTIKKIRDTIISEITPPPSNNKYESYDTNYNTTRKTDFPPQTIYSTFQLWGRSINFNDFETIAKFGPDIFSFLKWVIEFKSHPKNIPILFVSHSKTMSEFLKMLICNLNYNYNTPENNFFPTQTFVDVCTSARKTNTWSMRFKYLDYIVTGSRHAQSCDNMYKIFDESESKKETALKFGTLGLISANQRKDREKFGNYTNLSLWGIFSTLIFIHRNKDIISEFKNIETDPSGLMVLSGMAQQSKENIKDFRKDNELTCGDLSQRFSVPPDKKLSSGVVLLDNSLTLNLSPIDSLVNTIPPSIPLQEMSMFIRQRMSNELCSLGNIFKIEFEDCAKDGCKVKVTYAGPYNFEGIIKGRNYTEISSEDKKTIEALVQRKVYINIDNDSTDFILTLQNVYAGGFAIGEDGTQTIRGSVAQTLLPDKKVNIEPFKLPFTGASKIDSPEKKIEISSDFQESVRFLMGFDLIDATLVTYDTAYNTNILYSNLLIRQLLNTYLLISSDKAVNWGPGNPKTMYTNTKTFLSKDTAQLYGGKKNKKHNKHNNPKK
jgi:hypothetical protein